MLSILKKRLLDETGAMDRILVTLLLVIVGVAGLTGLVDWTKTQEETMQTETTKKIDLVTKDASGQ